MQLLKWPVRAFRLCGQFIKLLQLLQQVLQHYHLSLSASLTKKDEVRLSKTKIGKGG